MENDIINLNEMSKILDKHPNTVMKLAKEKKIPATKIADTWYSSKIALSMCVAGYNAKEIYEKIAEKMLKNASEVFI